MSIFDDLKDKLTEASSTTMQKAKDISETTRLNKVISDSQKQIQGLYSEIGYTVYCTYRENPIPEVAESFRQIDELLRGIEECQSQIKELNTGSICPSCGAKIKQGMKFCSICGSELKLEELNIPKKEETAYCSECGAPMGADAVFCTECGNKVK